MGNLEKNLQLFMLASVLSMFELIVFDIGGIGAVF
jgi:hypothetical protein